MISEAHREHRRQSYGPRELAATFLRHKKKAAFFALSVIGLATLVVIFAPRKYRSEARLFLQVGRESVRLDPTATTGETIALQQSGRDNEIATAVEVLKSRAIAEQAVDALTPEVVLAESGAEKSEPHAVADVLVAPLRIVAAALKSIDPISKREEAVIAIMDNFAVGAEFDSTVIVLTYDAETPQLAQQVMVAVVAAFRETYVDLHRTSGSKPFFAQQRAELEQRLGDAETALRDAKNRIGVASVEARRRTIETRLSSVELSRNTAVQQVSAAEARIKALKERTAAMPATMHTSTTVSPNTGADQLRSQLYALQVELLNLEAKHTAEHPLVASKRSQVKEALTMVEGVAASREATTASLNETHQALLLDLEKVQNQLAGLHAQLAELDAQRVVALADLRELNQHEVEIDRLDRAVSLANANFFRYSEALEQARMDEELDKQKINNVNEAQPATLAEKPVSPSKVIIGVLSLALATAGATLLVLACESFDSHLRNEDQIELLLEIPVIAAVPEGRHYGSLPVAVR